ncbi:tyrosine recombinase [Chrysochromulina parva virophage Curly]|nr:tyrosine recombinase [Chrysochromulina parva virophage Curly]
MATEFELFSASYAEKAKNTIKTYNNAYKKLHDELEQKDINTCTSTEIFQAIDKFQSANTKQSLLNVAIGVWKVYKLDTDDLVAYREDLAKSIKQSVKNNNKALQEVLPSYDELVKHTNDCFNTGKFVEYVVNFLILNFQVRNMDLNFKIISRLMDATDPELNYMVPMKSKVYYVRNKYKTSETYGSKQDIITDPDFITAIKRIQALNKDGHNVIIPNENTIAYRVQSLSYQNLGEGAMFKIIVNHFRDDIDELKKISLNRGTDINTILASYDIMNTK